jgi:hypothetical protein
MRSCTMTITPDMATKILERNTNNRPIRQKYVDYLATEMRAGRWRLTHQGVLIGADGEPLDGLHRLWAIVQAGVPVRMMVSTFDRTDGADAAMLLPIDTGITRTMADIVKEPRKVTDAWMFLARMANIGHRVSPDSVDIIGKVFGGVTRELIDYAPTNAVLFSSAPIKAAAVMAVHLGEDKQYVFDLYRNMTLRRSEEWPPVAHSFARAAPVRHKWRGESSVATELYVRGRYVFTEQWKKRRLQVFDYYRQEIIAQTKDTIQEILRAA